ncbi:hypothetical protein E2C01_049819 [Portunus trituberculatus]|uniref:Uncharacterized protein n=1 Tax=Portunus trituberculatus TaxID=210409 RepID=A0A5B7GH49_PORTR|nr:hypothetical protein [Portunus trituberculatus]
MVNTTSGNIRVKESDKDMTHFQIKTQENEEYPQGKSPKCSFKGVFTSCQPDVACFHETHTRNPTQRRPCLAT